MYLKIMGNSHETSTEHPPLIVERVGHVLVMRINRPDVRNAIDQATAEAIHRACDRLDVETDLRVGVITGQSGSFCSGQDLGAIRRGEGLARTARGVFGITEDPPRKPLLAAVEGPALGGGLELCLACDIVVASRAAVFGLPEVRRGLIARAGGLRRLPGRIPPGKAMEMALTGETYTAETMHGLGLVNMLTAPGSALDEALALARRVAANGPAAVRLSKRLIADAARQREDLELELHERLADDLGRTQDAHEGIAAFKERREPVWRDA